MRLLAACAALLALAASAHGAPARGASAQDRAGESEAAPRRWSALGGSASRSGVGAGRPLRVQPERAWSRRLRGSIEDGPVVWNDLVVVTSRETAASRRLHFLDLVSGRDVVPSLPVASTVPLAPSLWSRAVVVRRSERELAAFQIGDRRGTPFWSWRSAGPVGPPLSFGQEIHATTESGLVQLRLGRRDPVWRVPGTFRGSVSLLGDHVYAVRYDEVGGSMLVQVERSSGRVVAELATGHHGGKIPPQGERPLAVVTGGPILVHHAAPIVTREGTATAVLADAGPGAETARELASAPTFALRAAGLAAVSEDGHVLLLESERGRALSVRRRGADEPAVLLATEETAPAVLDDAAALARVGSVLYAGRFGVDLVDGRVLWRLPGDEPARSVPTGSGLLAVAGDATLEAWTRPNGGGAERELRRYEAGLAAALGDEYARLAERARRARDPELLRRLAQSARAWGANEARVAALDRHALLLERQRALVVDQTERREVLAAEARLSTFVADGLWRRAEELSARRADDDLRHLLLEEVLRHAPRHAEATAWVRAELPAELRDLGAFDPAEWLSFLRVTRAFPVRVAAEESGDGRASRALAEARSIWRRDAVAYESERLVVVTARATPPGAVARCLATGELVCDALAELFETRDAGGKLVLHLFPSRSEYLRFTQEHVEGGAGLTWTAGHFDPDAGLSRIFLPEDEGGWESVRRTYAHELTHHWLHERFAGGAGPHPRQRGFWIVEGFASLVEEFAFDLEGAAWVSENPRSHRLDVLARSDAGARIPWSELLEHTQASFQLLDGETVTRVAPTWVLGRYELLSERSLFYFQSAAVCRALLHADGGRHRAALLAFLGDYYAGRAARLDVRGAFAMTPEALGALAVRYAEEAAAEAASG